MKEETRPWNRVLLAAGPEVTNISINAKFSISDSLVGVKGGDLIFNTYCYDKPSLYTMISFNSCSLCSLRGQIPKLPKILRSILTIPALAKDRKKYSYFLCSSRRILRSIRTILADLTKDSKKYSYYSFSSRRIYGSIRTILALAEGF